MCNILKPFNVFVLPCKVLIQPFGWEGVGHEIQSRCSCKLLMCCFQVICNSLHSHGRWAAGSLESCPLCSAGFVSAFVLAGVRQLDLILEADDKLVAASISSSSCAWRKKKVMLLMSQFSLLEIINWTMTWPTGPLSTVGLWLEKFDFHCCTKDWTLEVEGVTSLTESSELVSFFKTRTL